MSIQNIIAHFRTGLTVYQHDFKSFGRASQLSDDEKVISADPDSIRMLFANDERLASRFLHFVNLGFEGVFLLRGNEWVTYGWFSRPRSTNPHHLPRWTRNLDACWIFYCHTKEMFRGFGYFAKLLRHIVEKVHGQELASHVYVDTHIANAASRRVILSAGFAPCGLITTYQLWVPRCGSVVLVGRWQRDHHHPPMETGTPQNPGVAVTQPTH